MKGKVLTSDESDAKQKIISTGNTEIDKRLGGGIPIGSLTLIEGQSDAGKSVLAQQMVWGSLRDKHKVVVFTTENTVKSLVTQMQSLGLDILDYLILGWLKIYPLQPARTDLNVCFETLLSSMKQHADCQLTIIDSLTPVIAYTSLEDVLSYFERCKGLCDEGRTVINIAHSFAFNEEILIRIRSMCDAHLRLGIEEVGDKLLKFLEVLKVRGADKGTGNILSFDVEPGIGMKILPLSKARV
jgi:flagellar protein FlaH